ncbi:MAG: RNA 2',3'-cyclic phosphodiesterase [Acidobacteriota bacterium]
MAGAVLGGRRRSALSYTGVTMRLFVALPLADRAAQELAEVCGRLRPEAPGLRWSAPESWHITLQFLGSSRAEQLDCLTLRLAELGAAPVAVRLGNLGVFARAGVFLVEVERRPELEELQRRVVDATAQCGYAAEARPYHPHITLARAKGDGRRQLRRIQERQAGKPAASDSTGAGGFTPFTATEFLLYESHLGPGGSKYEVKARFALNGSA